MHQHVQTFVSPCRALCPLLLTFLLQDKRRLAPENWFPFQSKLGETDKLKPASLKPSVSYGKWRPVVSGGQLINPGPPVTDGWMETNVNLLLPAPMMSFGTTVNITQKPAWSQNSNNGRWGCEGERLTGFQDPDSQSCHKFI